MDVVEEKPVSKQQQQRRQQQTTTKSASKWTVQSLFVHPKVKRKTRHKVKMKEHPPFVEKNKIIKQHINNNNSFCVTQFDNIVSCCVVLTSAVSLLIAFSILILSCDIVSAKKETTVISTTARTTAPSFSLSSLPVDSTVQQQQHQKKTAPAALANKKALATKVVAALEKQHQEQQKQDDLDLEQEETGKQHQEQKQWQRQRPQFDLRQESLIIASRWQTEIFLPCKIFGLDEEQTVSWVRKRDSLVITIDKLKLIDDHRFQLAQNENDWTLIISQPTNLDAGFYECQVPSMEPKLSRLIELKMVEANSYILSNTSSLIVRPNESVNVTCTIEAPQRTDFVYWYKNKEPIQFDNLKQRNNVNNITFKAQQTKSARWRRQQQGILKNDHQRDDGDDDDDVIIVAPAASQDEEQYDDDQEKPSRTTNKKLKLSSNTNSSSSSASSSSLTSKKAPTLFSSSTRKSNDGMATKKERPTVNNNDNTNQENDDNDTNEEDNDHQHVQLMQSSSSLIIKKTTLNDTANYTCLPSNAKPSHISIFVIENGAQSQPEKRSLQALDSASKPFTSIKDESLILIQQLKRKFFNIFTLVSSNYGNQNNNNYSHHQLMSMMSLKLNKFDQDLGGDDEEDEDFKEESMSSIIVRFSSNQDLLRIIITLITTIYLIKNY